MIKCLIVDDESHAIQLIKAYVEKLPTLQLVDTCQGSIKALTVLQEQTVDLIFLDMQMPDLSGFELIQTLNPRPQVIVISAHPEFALDGYTFDVVDYLLKPVPFDRFVEAVNKAQSRLQPIPSEKEEPKDHFYVRGEHKMIKIRLNEILFVESFREYAHVHTSAGKHIIRKSLNSMEEILGKDKFMRVHRSFIIHLDKIDAVFGNTIQIADHEISIGKSYKEAFFATVDLI